MTRAKSATISAHHLSAWDRYRVRAGASVDLDELPSGSASLCPDKAAARKLLKQHRKQISALAQILAAEQKRSLLVVLQGVDAAGKDGAIRKVFTGVNPQVCRVTAFKAPDREEKAHDYLWRIHRALPAYGEIAVFNRSHYEDVVALRARGEMSKRAAGTRLRQIADLERTWSENGITVCKFLLHISRDEQTRRFQSRLHNSSKHWKLDPSDFADRKRWPHFITAYDHALSVTAKPNAPWYIIPADHKWYRDLAVAAVVLRTLQQMKPRFPNPKIEKSQFKL